MPAPHSIPAPEIVPISHVVLLPERHRQTFDPVAQLELANSIRDHGLFHAIQVRQDGVTLVSGERRLRAIRDHLAPLAKTFFYAGVELPPLHIPVIRVTTDDPLALEEIELHENIVRKDLTWQELATTTARLKALRAAQAAARGDAPPTMASLAEEVRGSSLGINSTNTRNEVIVAKHLDDPEVAKAPTLKEAFKVLKRKEEAERVRALGVAVGATFSTSDHTVEQAECLAWMLKAVEDPTGPRFDVILTDPPYGMGAHEFGDGAGRVAGIEHDYDDSYETWQDLMRDWATLSFAVAKPQAHAYIFCDFDRFHELKGFLEAAGWYVFRTPLVNYKRTSGRVPLPDLGPKRQWEICLYANKGKKPTRALYSDVIVTDSDEQLSHGAQKPVALYIDLLKRSVVPGDAVLDTFAGTGPILPACQELKCRATAIERNAVYYGLCLERLAALSAQGEMVL